MILKRLSLFLLIASLGMSGAVNVVSARTRPVSSVLVAQSGPIVVPRGEASMSVRYAMEKRLEGFLSEQKMVFGMRTLQILPRTDADTNNAYDVFTATGFPINKDTIATVNHIIKDPKKVEAMVGGRWKKLSLVGRIQTKDMSFFTFKDADFGGGLLKFKTIETVLESFPKDRATAPLDSVMVGMKCMEGNTSRVVIGEILQIQPSTGLFAFSIAGSGAGCSGAPLFSYDGYVIGVCQIGVDGGVVAYALDIGKFVDAFGAFQKEQ